MALEEDDSHTLDLVWANAERQPRCDEAQTRALRGQLIVAGPDADSETSRAVAVHHSDLAAGGALQHVDGCEHRSEPTALLASWPDDALGADGLTSDARTAIAPTRSLVGAACEVDDGGSRG